MVEMVWRRRQLGIIIDTAKAWVQDFSNDEPKAEVRHLGHAKLGVVKHIAKGHKRASVARAHERHQHLHAAVDAHAAVSGEHGAKHAPHGEASSHRTSSHADDSKRGSHGEGGEASPRHETSPRHDLRISLTSCCCLVTCRGRSGR